MNIHEHESRILNTRNSILQQFSVAQLVFGKVFVRPFKPCYCLFLCYISRRDRKEVGMRLKIKYHI